MVVLRSASAARRAQVQAEAAGAAADAALNAEVQAALLVLSEAGHADAVIERIGPLWRVKAGRKSSVGGSIATALAGAL